MMSVCLVMTVSEGCYLISVQMLSLQENLIVGVKTVGDGFGDVRLTVYGSNLMPLPASSSMTALVLVAEKVVILASCRY